MKNSTEAVKLWALHQKLNKKAPLSFDGTDRVPLGGVHNFEGKPRVTISRSCFGARQGRPKVTSNWYIVEKDR